MIEHLESRIAPASIVITTSGTSFKVRGATPADTLGLEFFASSSGGFDLIDPSSTDVISVNGSVAQAPPSGSYLLHFPGASGDIIITGGKNSPGNFIQFSNGLFGGNGYIGGKLVMDFPAGNNNVELGVLNIGGGFLATMGPGNDRISFFSDTHIGGLTKLNLGDGNNTVNATSDLVSSLSFGGSFKYTGGTGIDSVTLSAGGSGAGYGLSIFGNLNYFPGDGLSTFSLNAPSVTIGNSFVIKEGNNLSGSESTVSLGGGLGGNGFAGFDVGSNLTWTTGGGLHTFFASVSNLNVGGKLSLSQGGIGDISFLRAFAQFGSIKALVIPAKAGLPAVPAGSGSFTFSGAGLKIAGVASFSGLSSVTLNASGSISGPLTVSGESTLILESASSQTPLEIGGIAKISPVASESNPTRSALLNVRFYGNLSFNGTANADALLLNSVQIFGLTKVAMGAGTDLVQISQTAGAIQSVYAGPASFDFGADPAAMSDAFAASSNVSGSPVLFLGAVKFLHDDTGDTITDSTGVVFTLPPKVTP